VGLPIGYEISADSTTDITPVEDLVGMMEAKCGQAKRIPTATLPSSLC
jgi:hypothetical protein